MTNVFDRVSRPLLAAVSDGLSLDEACNSLEVKENTVRGWLRKGRRDPEGRYGEFARSLDAARASRDAAVAALGGPLTSDEFERLLADLSRKGSVAALKLWADRHPAEQDYGTGDSFGRFDELANRRGGRGA